MQLKRGPRPSKADGGFSFDPASINQRLPCAANEWRTHMSLFSRRSLLGSALLVGLLPASVLAADKPKEIRLDWATYNPVSMVLKQEGLLEKEFAKDGIAIRWVQTLG